MVELHQITAFSAESGSARSIKERGVPHLFRRYHCPTPRSLALRAHNHYETELNEHFWSFEVMSSYAGYIARQKNKIDAGYSTAVLFSAEGGDSRRIPPTVAEWLAAKDELANWLRSSVIVSAIASHEAYMRQIIRSALMSDPLCRFDLPRKIDGTSLLKDGKELSFDVEIKSTTRGAWDARLSSFKKIFKAAGDDVFGDMKSLEDMRSFRNNFAHGFGRDIETPTPSNWSFKPSQRLSQARFVKWLGVLSSSASSIDNTLLNTYIGSFEIIHYYHEWKKLGRRPEEINLEEARALKNNIYRDLQFTTSPKYCQDLVGFYLRM